MLTEREVGGTADEGILFFRCSWTSNVLMLEWEEKVAFLFKVEKVHTLKKLGKVHKKVHLYLEPKQSSVLERVKPWGIGAEAFL